AARGAPYRGITPSSPCGSGGNPLCPTPVCRARGATSSANPDTSPCATRSTRGCTPTVPSTPPSPRTSGGRWSPRTGPAAIAWRSPVAAYRDHGHTVENVKPVPGLPDMVFAANAAVVVEGRVFGSLFHAPERRPESAAYETWFKAEGYEVHHPESVCEGEGDLVPAGRWILAGTGFRTTREAHREVQEHFGVPVISLTLVDPYFYHLDTALFVLDDENVAYYP